MFNMQQFKTDTFVHWTRVYIQQWVGGTHFEWLPSSAQQYDEYQRRGAQTSYYQYSAITLCYFRLKVEKKVNFEIYIADRKATTCM